MKKRFVIALALLLVLCLCACNKAAEKGNTPVVPVAKDFVFPEGTSVMGVDLTGMDRDAGWKALNDMVSAHTMTFNIDGVEVSTTAQELGLACSQERYNAIADAAEAGAVEFKTEGLIQFNEGKLRALVNDQFNKPVTEAAIIFDEEADVFVLTPDAMGQKSNPNALVSQLREKVLSLDKSAELTGVSQLIEPTIRDEDEAVAAALEKVNKMLSVELTYSFTCEGKTSTLTIPRDTILSLINLGTDNVTPGINQYDLESYVAQLSDTYSASSTKGNFVTTGGGTVGLTVSYNGVYLDQEAMAADLAACITDGVSGSRTAPFKASGIRNMPYGGTYIEVNLSSQYLWFYKNGECILSTSFVSGNVNTGHITPNGVFSINYKSPDTYLEGEDYRTFVNFWMPFYGGYGLHDATWRGSFGGDIYLYNGSHGCVNLPYGAASTIYSYAPVGTPVIVYGGRTSVPAQPQSLSGTTYYSVAEDEGPITLNISPRYSGPTMSYSSNNTSVATVSGNVVTIKGVGTAVITVSVPAYDGYTSASIDVTINVISACAAGRHKYGTATPITPADCRPGSESVTCEKCGDTITREVLPVKDHSFGNWSQTVAPTCGANGEEERVCTICNTEKQTRPVVPSTPIAHTPGAPQTIKDPNCTDKGITETRCTVCSTLIETGELPTVPTAHVGGDVEEKLPSCTEGGYRKQNCSKCGAVLLDEVLNSPGHSTTTETVGATCGAAGYTKVYCTTCNAVESETPIPATGAHNIVDGVCTVCGASG